MPGRPSSSIAGALVHLPMACAISLLPGSWRARFTGNGEHHLLLGVLVTGLVEVAVGAATLAEVTILAGNHALEGLTHPAVLLGLAVGLEGVVRLGSAWVGTIIGTTPLWLLSLVHLGARTGHAAVRSRHAAPDRVTRVEGGLQIDSAAPKPWHETTTLEIDGTFYRVARASRWDDPQRPHRYHLEPLPTGWLIRRVEVYPPEGEGGPDQSSTKV